MVSVCAREGVGGIVEEISSLKRLSSIEMGCPGTCEVTIPEVLKKQLDVTPSAMD